MCVATGCTRTRLAAEQCARIVWPALAIALILIGPAARTRRIARPTRLSLGLALSARRLTLTLSVTLRLALAAFLSATRR